MKASALLAAVVAFVLGASITFAVVRWLDLEKPELAFVVGAIVGTQAGVIVHHRSVDARNTLGIKCLLGAVLAVTAVVFGLILDRLFAPFKFVEISIPFAAIGSFGFPLVIFNTMWTALSKTKGA